MTTELSSPQSILEDYLHNYRICPIFFQGDAKAVLRILPDSIFDMAMTSPPYWGKREYSNGGIGLETDFHHYISNLVTICGEVKRVLKPTGSFWLNIGDSYQNKNLCGIPWRVATRMIDEQGWTLRNSVIWNKVKGGPDNTKDRLRNVHEIVFHFVKCPQGYYFNADAIRNSPRTTKIINGSVVSATGVRGVRYRRQIELSTELTDGEKRNAFAALDTMLVSVGKGDISDFRMIIRGQQRTTHSNSESVSGRAKELKDKGFYFLKYHPNGSKPGDVWDIIPEDTQRRKVHFAAYPEDLCRIPIMATCPRNGIVLDPFCGTGTTMFVASNLGIKSVGIDISEEYLLEARRRCRTIL